MTAVTPAINRDTCKAALNGARKPKWQPRFPPPTYSRIIHLITNKSVIDLTFSSLARRALNMLWPQLQFTLLFSPLQARTELLCGSLAPGMLPFSTPYCLVWKLLSNAHTKQSVTVKGSRTTNNVPSLRRGRERRKQNPRGSVHWQDVVEALWPLDDDEGCPLPGGGREGGRGREASEQRFHGVVQLHEVLHVQGQAGLPVVAVRVQRQPRKGVVAF